jgi:5-methylthioadenosine/S-adenosylhomocysteine deaminase
VSAGTLVVAGGHLPSLGEPGAGAPVGWVRLSRGLIADRGIGPAPAGTGERVVDAAGCFVLPGFLNGHTHLEQTALRGRGDGLRLASWLDRVIRPAESSMSVADIHTAALAGLADNLESGVVTVVQHQKVTASSDHVAAVADAAEQLGVRLRLMRGWRDSGRYAESAGACAEQVTRLARRLATSSHTTIAIGPMAPWRCSERGMAEIVAFAAGEGLTLHMHISETVEEVDQVVAERGLRPVEWLDRIGALGPATELVHCVHLSPIEMSLIADSGATVVHCPASNLMLGSGIAPLASLIDRGIPVSIGSDGAATWTNSPLALARLAQLLARGTTGRADAIAAVDAFAMATGGAARSTGLHPGVPADLAVVAAPNWDVDRDVTSLLVAGTDVAVRAVVVAGELVVADGRVVGVDHRMRYSA